MKVFLQRVLSAQVDIDGKILSKIAHGYLLLVGFEEGDGYEVAAKMAHKIIKARLFADTNGKTNLSIKEKGGAILSVSQFTLAADMKEGNRPSFAHALAPLEAKNLYSLFNNLLREDGLEVLEGVFGADMQVSLVNDGPFSILFDSHHLFETKGK